MKLAKINFLTILFILAITVSLFGKTTDNLTRSKGQFFDYPTRYEILDYIKKIEEKIKFDPEDYENYEILAMYYDYLGEYDKSLAALQEELKYYPQNDTDIAIVYSNIARQNLKLMNLEKAKIAIDKALEYKPDDLVIREHLLEYYILQKEFPEFAKELKKLSAADPARDYYYDFYLYAWEKLKDPQELLRLFAQTIKEDPGNHLAHRIFATAQRNAYFLKGDGDDLLKNFPQILEAFQKSLKLSPRYIPTHISIANTYMMLAVKTKDKRYFKDALNWFSQAEKIDAKDLPLVAAIGNLFLYMEKYDRAIARLEFAISHGSDAEWVSDNLAVAYNNQAYSFYLKGKKLKKGLELVEKALALKPNDGIFLSTKAELLFKMKRYNEAYEYIKKAVILEPDEAEIKKDYADIEAALRARPDR